MEEFLCKKDGLTNFFAQTNDERVVVGGRNSPIYAARGACPMGRKKEVIDAHREGTSGIGETRTMACLTIGRVETIRESLVCIGYWSFVEIAASNDGMTGIAVDEGTDAVGLCSTVGGSFAQFAHE